MEPRWAFLVAPVRGDGRHEGHRVVRDDPGVGADEGEVVRDREGVGEVRHDHEDLDLQVERGRGVVVEEDADREGEGEDVGREGPADAGDDDECGRVGRGDEDDLDHDFDHV